MFKKIIFVAAFAIVAIGASAQTKIGLKGSISFPTVKQSEGTSSSTSSSIVTPNIGLTIDFPGSKSFNIQSGLLYNAMGGKLTDGNWNTTVNFGFLSIPVLAKFELGSGFHGYAGPQLSFLLYANEKNNHGTIDTKEEFKGSHLFGIFGLGYNLSKKVNIFGEYFAGISNLTKETRNGYKCTTNAFSIGFGINLK